MGRYSRVVRDIILFNRKINKKIFLFYFIILSKFNFVPFQLFMGGSKNRTIGRFYIDDFWKNNLNCITGDVLEIGRRNYFNDIDSSRISSYQCLDIAKFEDVDIVADIQDMPQILDNTYDTIICTQVLEHLESPQSAINEIYRILKKKGVLLLSVPFLNNYHMEPHDYWRFTEFSVRYLLKNFTSKDINNYGNSNVFTLASMGFTSKEIPKWLLFKSEEPIHFPIIITAKAIK